MIYKYKIYCQTDSKFEYVTVSTPPTTCPTNAAHTCDLTSVAIESMTPSFPNVVSAVTTSTTSILDVALNSMSLTPDPGEYLVVFSALLDFSVAAQDISVSLYVDGSLVAGSTRIYNAGNAVLLGLVYTPPSTSAIIQEKISVTGSEVVEIRWKTSTGVATAKNRNLSLIKV